MKGKVKKARNPQSCLSFILHPGALAGADSFAGSLVLLGVCSVHFDLLPDAQTTCANQKLPHLCFVFFRFSLDADFYTDL